MSSLGESTFCEKGGITLQQHIIIIANHHRTHESDFRVTEKLTMTHDDYIAMPTIKKDVNEDYVEEFQSQAICINDDQRTPKKNTYRSKT
jgi:hypothetical protein